MILGLLSDTHGQAQRAARAIELLKSQGASTFIHCGDVCGEGVLAVLAGEPAWFVWGNCDVAEAGLGTMAAQIGLSLPRDVPLQLELAGKQVAVFHGHEPEFAPAYVRLAGEEVNVPPAFARFDYIFYGHTHQKNDQRWGHLRLINPGALHRARPYTVATLDLASDKLEYHTVV